MHSFQHAAQNPGQASRMLRLRFSQTPSLRFFLRQEPQPKRRAKPAPPRFRASPVRKYTKTPLLHAACGLHRPDLVEPFDHQCYWQLSSACRPAQVYPQNASHVSHRCAGSQVCSSSSQFPCHFPEWVLRAGTVPRPPGQAGEGGAPAVAAAVRQRRRIRRGRCLLRRLRHAGALLLDVQPFCVADLCRTVTLGAAYWAHRGACIQKNHRFHLGTS